MPCNSLWARALVVFALLLALLIHILADLRLSHTSSGVLVVPACAVMLGTIVVASALTIRKRTPTQSALYWLATVAVTFYLLAFHVTAVIAAFLTHQRVVSGQLLWRTLGMSYVAVVYGGLKPLKAW
jgi:hypothetical protein